MMGNEVIKVKLTRSLIGLKPKARRTLLALGLRKIGDERELKGTREIKNMIDKVSHVLTICGDSGK